MTVGGVGGGRGMPVVKGDVHLRLRARDEMVEAPRRPDALLPCTAPTFTSDVNPSLIMASELGNYFLAHTHSGHSSRYRPSV